MLRGLKLVIFTFFFSINAFSQLSDGEGKTQSIADGRYEMYLPKHFVISENPAGIRHNASGTFVFIIPVPKNQKTTRGQAMSTDVLIDERMSNVNFSEQSPSILGRASDEQLYNMSYELEGQPFERINLIINYKRDQYIVIGNYHIAVKNQVLDEVNKAVQSVRFLY